MSITFVKSIDGTGYLAECHTGGIKLTYTILRRGSRFQLTINGYDEGKQQTLAGCKTLAESNYAEWEALSEKVAKKAAESAKVYESAVIDAERTPGAHDTYEVIVARMAKAKKSTPAPEKVAPAPVQAPALKTGDSVRLNNGTTRHTVKEIKGERVIMEDGYGYDAAIVHPFDAPRLDTSAYGAVDAPKPIQAVQMEKLAKASAVIPGVSNPAPIKAVGTITQASPARPASPLAAKLTEKLKPAIAPGIPHVIVKARAGSGKTTTLIEGLKVRMGAGTTFTPSEQQAAVWEALCLGDCPSSVCFVAFNSSIATELKSRVPAGCDAMTMHSLGLRAVRSAFNLPPIKDEDKYRVDNLISELLGKDIRDLRKEMPIVLQATKKLVDLCKMNLTGLAPGGRTVFADTITSEDLDDLVSHYDVDVTEEGGRSWEKEIFDLVPRVLDRCLDVTKDSYIDFSDMVWLPVALDLPMRRYDLLLVDEAQDLNRCQQALAKKAGRRLILCGDPCQAIYGFAGADSESMPRMFTELSATPAGCIELPLTVTRRCGKAIVAEANKIVPDFSAFESNGLGKVSNAVYSFQKRDGETVELPWEKTYATQCVAGDMVLCRVNAPLVQQCFRFLCRGLKATIQGRDIGQSLIATIDKLKATSVSDLIAKLDDWSYREITTEQAKRNPCETKIMAIHDKAECLVCFTEGAVTVADVIGKINSVFTDDKVTPGIKLSSIHRAKGLESNRVFFLMPEGSGCPHPMVSSAWQREQEFNLLYVGITRAKNELIFVR